jgi:hypothetical protein
MLLKGGMVGAVPKRGTDRKACIRGDRIVINALTALPGEKHSESGRLQSAGR